MAGVGGEFAKQKKPVEEWRQTLDEAMDDAAQAVDDFTTDAQNDLQRFIDEQRINAEATRDWQANLVEIARATSGEFASYLATLGPEFAGTVQEMTENGDKLNESFYLWAAGAGSSSATIGEQFDKAAVRMGGAVTRGRDEVNWILGEMRGDVSDRAHEIGDALATGIADGIQRSKWLISDAVNDVARDAWTQVIGSLGSADRARQTALATRRQ